MEIPRETPIRGIKTRPPIDEYVKPAYGIHQIAEMIDEVSRDLPSCSAPHVSDDVWQLIHHEDTVKFTGRLNAILERFRAGALVEADDQTKRMEITRRNCLSYVDGEQKYILQLQNAQRIVQDYLELQRRIIVRELSVFAERQGGAEAAMKKLRRLQALTEELRGVGLLRKLAQRVEKARLAVQVPIAELEKVFKVEIKIKFSPDNIEIIQERGSPGWILQQHLGSLDGDMRVAESRIKILRGLAGRIDFFLSRVKAGNYNPI